jgi:hypothetical protein
VKKQLHYGCLNIRHYREEGTNHLAQRFVMRDHVAARAARYDDERKTLKKAIKCR